MQITTGEATLGVAIINAAGLVAVAIVTRGHGIRIRRSVDEVADKVRTSNGHTIGELVEQTAETIGSSSSPLPPAAPDQRVG